jgi:hypothetical protein
MVHLPQTVHLSYTNTNTIFKLTEMRFQMTQVTKEFHRLCQKWFSSLWYIMCKPCTYLASRLALSPNGLKRASSWACLAQTVHLSCALLTSKYHQVRPKRFLCLWYVWRKLCTYLAPTLTSPNGPKQDSTWPTSPSSSIGCVQNYFWAYGTFGTNHAPILCHDYVQIDQNELLVEPHHQGVPSGSSKKISEPKVRLAQTVHQSCIDTNTASKQTETRYQMSHVT